MKKTSKCIGAISICLATVIGPSYQVTIPGNLLERNNVLEVHVSNSMANRVAYMDRNNMTWQNFYNINVSARRPENRGKDGVFTAAKWQPEDSGLIGPVTITPVSLQTGSAERQAITQ